MLNYKLSDFSGNKTKVITFITLLIPFFLKLTLHIKNITHNQIDFYLFSEYGLYENLTVVFSAISIFYILQKDLNDRMLQAYTALLVFYILEEISWGYHLLKHILDYSPFISELNGQQESSFHNLQISPLSNYELGTLLEYSLIIALILVCINGSKYISRYTAGASLISAYTLEIIIEFFGLDSNNQMYDYTEVSECLISFFIACNFKFMYQNSLQPQEVRS